VTATQRLETIDNLLQGISRITAHLGHEASEVQTMWAGIKHAGGARDDHAAELLMRLRPHLVALEHFAQRCQGQLDQAAADPFGDQAKREAVTA